MVRPRKNSPQGIFHPEFFESNGDFLIEEEARPLFCMKSYPFLLLNGIQDSAQGSVVYFGGEPFFFKMQTQCSASLGGRDFGQGEEHKRAQQKKRCTF
jgi:hypothetical protein